VKVEGEISKIFSQAVAKLQGRVNYFHNIQIKKNAIIWAKKQYFKNQAEFY
jgi:hypothetical protein